jgi:hypothetical protein
MSGINNSLTARGLFGKYEGIAIELDNQASSDAVVALPRQRRSGLARP